MTVDEIPAGAEPALFGKEGELNLLRISVEPRLLEDLLEALAGLEFPVNPELYHYPNEVTVEFPAYSARIGEVRAAVRKFGVAGDLGISRMLGRAAGS